MGVTTLKLEPLKKYRIVYSKDSGQRIVHSYCTAESAKEIIDPQELIYRINALQETIDNYCLEIRRQLINVSKAADEKMLAINDWTMQTEIKAYANSTNSSGKLNPLNPAIKLSKIQSLIAEDKEKYIEEAIKLYNSTQTNNNTNARNKAWFIESHLESQDQTLNAWVEEIEISQEEVILR